MKQKLLIAGAAVFAALFVCSGIMLYQQYTDGRKTEDTFANLAAIVDVEPVATPIPPAGITEESAKSTAQNAFDHYARAYGKNTDMIGWITIDDTRINYPVMQSKDRPDYYLKHNFDKQYSAYGVPYISESCDADVSDNTIVYGHHMNNGSMFSDLCKYTSENFYKKHKTIRFDTLGGYGTYEIIAAFKTVAYSSSGFVYDRFVMANEESDFNTYIQKCKELSLYNTGVNAVYGDKLLTLSTCEYSQTNGRMVVIAKKVGE